MNNIICKIFGHNWIYHQEKIRNCKCCHRVQQIKTFGPITDWMWTIQFTKKGAEHWLKFLELKKN